MTLQTAFWMVCAGYWLLGMHFFMHNPGGAGLYLPFNAWGWIFASLLIGLGLWKIAQRQRMVFSSLQRWLWVGALLMCVPMLYPGAEFKAQALPRLLGLFAGMLFLLGLYQWRFQREDRDRALHLLLGAVAVEAALGLTQYFLLTPGNWIGYDTQINRPFGIFQQPNVMATFMATGMALAVWLESRGDGNPWLRSLRCGVIVAASMLLVILQSRVGQLGGLLALLLLTPHMFQHKRLLRMLGLVGLGIALALISQAEGSQGGIQRGMSMYQSAGVRTVYWSHALQMIAQSPWTGWGYGGFEASFLHQYADRLAAHPGLPSIGENVDHPHNEVLFWAIEGGLAPMLGLALMAGALLARLRRAGWAQGLGLLALLTPILLHTQTEYPLYHAIALWWALLLLIFVMDAEVEDALQSRGQRSWSDSVYQLTLPLRLAAILIPLVILPFMLTGLHTAWLVMKFERSGRIDTDVLYSVVNPLPWLARVESIAYTLRLQEGLLSRDQEHLQAYVDWAQARVRHAPRAIIYANLVRALQVLDRREEASRVQAQALRLYPGHPTLTQVLSPTAASASAK